MNSKCNRGMTMVEIMVAFVMLALVMGISYSSIRFASNLTKEATDVDRKNERFQSAVADYFRDEEHYKLSPATDIQYTFVGENEDGSQNGPYTLRVKGAKKSFKDDGVIFVPASDDTGDNVRNMYLFSTDY